MTYQERARTSRGDLISKHSDTFLLEKISLEVLTHSLEWWEKIGKYLFEENVFLIIDLYCHEREIHMISRMFKQKQMIVDVAIYVR